MTTRPEKESPAEQEFNIPRGESDDTQATVPSYLWGEEKQCILAVDDLPENIEILRNLLGREYQIKAATKGSKAIEIAKRHPQPDIILLDIMMPEMDGFEVCRILKSDADTLQIPIVFITGNNDVINEAEGFELGATDYIAKPFHPAAIRARVQTHLQLQKEKKRVDRLLSNLFPARIIQDLKFRGMSNPELFNPVTLMFAELYSDYGSTFSPDEIARELTDMFTVLDGLTARNGAERLKYSCYTYVAASGIPVPNINHACIMVQTAIDFLFFLNTSAHCKKKGWKARIGVHSGKVVGGIVGRKQCHYDIFGDDVRTAMHLKSLAPSMGLLISETTMQQIQGYYPFTPFTPHTTNLEVKIPLYEFTGNRNQFFSV